MPVRDVQAEIAFLKAKRLLFEENGHYLTLVIWDRKLSVGEAMEMTRHPENLRMKESLAALEGLDVRLSLDQDRLTYSAPHGT
jgi:hypothetical protein